MEHLPGMEHMMYGLYVESGDEALAPIFYFGYCSDVVSNIVQVNSIFFIKIVLRSSNLN